MKIGIQLAFNDLTSPDFMAQTGRMVEAQGFHSLWVPEHVLFFPEYVSRYPYAANGKIPGNPKSLLEPFTALTYLAAHTQHLRLGTGICLVPQRNPVYCAKQVADLDFLSSGRLDFGIGIGWLKEEFEALGVPWQRRATRTLECIAVMKTLWCDEVSNYQGEFYEVKQAYQNPKPIQKPHPPLFFGGESEAALKRVATVGQGWYGYNLTPTDFEKKLKLLETLLSDNGRSRAELQIYVAPAREFKNVEGLKQFKDLGADQVIFAGFATHEEQLKKFSAGLLEMHQAAL